jgi:histone deacetylase HOS3
MENHGHNPANDCPGADSSPTPVQQRPRRGTPNDSDLARALLSLSFTSSEQHSTPPSNKTPSSQFPGSYPETPAQPRHTPVALPVHETFYTPIHEPSSLQPLQYPNVNGFESSPERDRSESPTPSAPHRQLPSPEKTPEPTTRPAKSKTLVIIHDACSKHKFSRNVKARELATIVERPERCRASILGIAAAKARLEIEGFDAERFDIIKSDRLGDLSDQAVVDVHGEKWPTELTSLCNSAAEKLSTGDLEIPPSYHSGDLYLCQGSHEAIRGCIGSVYDGIDRVLADGYDRVHVSVRPPGHHCAETMPSGFCMINNVHIAIAYAHRNYGITRAVILDFDLHHGDGSQAIAWTINDKTNQLKNASRSPRHLSLSPGLRIGYFSLHDINSFPCEEGSTEKVQEASLCLTAHGQSIWNIHLRHHPTNAAFDNVYESEYSIIFKRAAEFLADAGATEKCMVFLSAGFDASEHETKGMQRHGYNLPTHFYQRFACDSINLADRYASGKILSVLEGGYADRAITSGSFAYMIGLSGVSESSVDRKSWEWWSVPRLTMLEKGSKKQITKMNNGTQVDNDARWVSQSLIIASQLLPATFAPSDNTTVDPALLATPRAGLRERKKPVMLATAPPSAVKKRQQRVATPRARKSMTGTETFVQNTEAPPVPTILQREVSPGTGLSELMQSMNLANSVQEQKRSDTDFGESEKSFPGTPTPTGKGGLGDNLR